MVKVDRNSPIPTSISQNVSISSTFELITPLQIFIIHVSSSSLSFSFYLLLLPKGKPQASLIISSFFGALYQCIHILTRNLNLMLHHFIQFTIDFWIIHLLAFSLALTKPSTIFLKNLRNVIIFIANFFLRPNFMPYGLFFFINLLH